MSTALIGIIMGSKSDLDTMSHASTTLDELGVEHDVRILSAHRTPDAVTDYLASAEERGVQVIIAAAGFAAHLAGVCASKTLLPVIGVPMPGGHLQGMDALLSTVQMPAGIPVATMAIGKAGAINAALFATSMLGNGDARFRDAIRDHRARKAEAVLDANREVMV